MMGDRDAWIASARAVRIEDVFERRGIKLRQQGAEHVGRAPIAAAQTWRWVES
jgi:hypothetical protein